VGEKIYLACFDVGLVLVIMLIILLIHICFKLQSLIYQEEDFFKKQKKKLEESSVEKINKDKEILAYSESLLKSIRDAIAAVSSIKYKEFSDNHNIEKITKEHFKRMIEDTVSTIKTDINFSNIDYDNIIYTKEYINRYIIDTTVYILKNMFNTEIDEM
jgi:biopolymer transport protein ExbB/TolQ